MRTTWSSQSSPSTSARSQECAFRALTIDFRLTSLLGSAGQVAEWLKAPVSKTGIPFTRYREFESLPVRTNRPPWLPRTVQHAWCPGRCADRRGLGVTRVSGWVAEWFKAHAWKACVRESVPRVRISPHPSAPPNVVTSGGAGMFPGETGDCSPFLRSRQPRGVPGNVCGAVCIRPSAVGPRRARRGNGLRD